MDNDIAIKVECVSKKYCKSLKRSMLYGVKDIGRNMLGLNSHSEKLRESEFWAVDDVSFEIKKGETFGVIGPNGSGKTTLLKMLNGIFWPDKGKITVKGKVGALIEVGAGFHPLLTGRENIYINAAILGMTKKEVDKKFDSIVDFADIGDFLDVPVKNYSSGMYVRLGFAVAVHCEPDILLVDEVLAVGDVAFRAKCLKKILSLKEIGTSTVFVSHDFSTVVRICSTIMCLNRGKCVFIGDAALAFEHYNSIKKEETLSAVTSQISESIIRGIDVLGVNDKPVNEIGCGEKLKIKIYYSTKNKIKNPNIIVSLKSTDGTIHSGASTFYDSFPVDYLEGNGSITVCFDKVILGPGDYFINVSMLDQNNIVIYEQCFNIEKIRIRYNRKIIGNIELPHTWNVKKNEKRQ